MTPGPGTATHQSPFWDQNKQGGKRMGKKTNWIAGAIKKPGALHKALGIKKGRKIPASELAIKKGDSTLMKRRKNLAKTLGRMRKK